MSKNLLIADRLDDLITKAGTTGVAIAAATGVSTTTISDVRNDKRVNMSADTVAALCRHFNVPTDYLLGLSDVPSLDITVQKIHKATGLSEKAIRVLKSSSNSDDIRKNRIDFLNDLLEDPATIYELALVYHEYKSHIRKVHEIEKIEYDNPIALESKPTEKYNLIRCNNMFELFLENQAKLWKEEK